MIGAAFQPPEQLQRQHKEAPAQEGASARRLERKEARAHACASARTREFSSVCHHAMLGCAETNNTSSMSVVVCDFAAQLSISVHDRLLSSPSFFCYASTYLRA